ncbi:uncharacterized protein [Branchiostoma lanceolatum]|uniref:uncharacterized protein n=1 Tax=Branchiostoma lanceolatum TaxID=7740 RepID=UPI0034540D23
MKATKKRRTKQDGARHPMMITAAASLFYARNRNMSTLQVIQGLGLFKCHASKVLYQRMNTCGLAVSHKKILQTVDKLSANYNREVLAWKAGVERKGRSSQTAQSDVHMQSGEHGEHTQGESNSSQTAQSDVHMQSGEHGEHTQGESDSSQTAQKDVHMQSGEHGEHTQGESNSSQTAQSDVHMQSGEHGEHTQGESDSSQTAQKDVHMQSGEHGEHTQGDSNSSQTAQSDVHMQSGEHGEHTQGESDSSQTAQSDIHMQSGEHGEDPQGESDSSQTAQSDVHMQSGEHGEHTQGESDSSQTAQSDVHMQSGGVSSPGYGLVFDNIDIHQKVRHKTSQNSNKDHHFVHTYAVLDRVNVQHLPDDRPMADILSVPLKEFLPNDEDCSSLRDDMITISSREVVQHMPFFNKYFKDCAQEHIPHMFSEQANQKSHIEPLGILQKNETKHEDMIAILEEYHQYVPEGQKIPLEGDGLSNMRGVESQDARADGATAAERLEGLELVTAEWHAHVTALQDVYDEYYKTTSAREKGTLFQLRNRFDRRNVTQTTKDSFNANREFLHFVSSGMLILAVMETLGLSDINGRPPDAPRGIEINSLECRRAYLRTAVGKVIDQHVLLSFNTNAVVYDVVTEQATVVPEGRVPCGFPGCPKHYARNGACLRRHREQCVWRRLEVHGEDTQGENDSSQTAQSDVHMQSGEHEEDTQGESDSSQTDDKKEDFLYNYNCSVLREGLFDLVKKDSVNEGDGSRILRNWKFDMIQYYQHKHTHYKDLAFRYISQHKALLTPRLSASILHNKTINIHGLPGKNIPKDLHMEFLNKKVKEGLARLGPNMTSRTITREGRSLKVIQDVLDTLDKDLGAYRGIGKHTVPDISQEIHMLVEDLKPEDPFKVRPGRFHPTFPNCRQSRHHNINSKKMTAWMIGQKEKLGRRQHLL